MTRPDRVLDQPGCGGHVRFGIEPARARETGVSTRKDPGASKELEKTGGVGLRMHCIGIAPTLASHDVQGLFDQTFREVLFDQRAPRLNSGPGSPAALRGLMLGHRTLISGVGLA